MKKLQPPDWAEPKGYANGIIARGSLIFVGGQIGWTSSQQFESDDFIVQTRQALLNIVAVLQAAGAGPEHMVRMTWYVVDRIEYTARLKELGAVYREVMGKNFPAMTCVEVSGLVEDRARIEIEVTAVMPDCKHAANTWLTWSTRWLNRCQACRGCQRCGRSSVI